MRSILVLSLILTACAPRASEPAVAPDPVARDEVVTVIDGMFDAMRAGDSASLRRAFHPNARLMSVSAERAPAELRIVPISDFIDAVGTPRTEVWDERIGDIRVTFDGPLATAWMEYAFHLDDALSHCGVNAMQLYRSADGWKVFHVADTRRREGCSSQEAAR